MIAISIRRYLSISSAEESEESVDETPPLRLM